MTGGKAWVITNEQGRLIHDIDTDQIFHNSHLAITNIEEMGRFAFGNLPGWEDFPQKVASGDIVIVGKNFGCGSSRQQAVDCFRTLGVRAIVAVSFGAIYRRNAINSGLRMLRLNTEKKDMEKNRGEECRIEILPTTAPKLYTKATISMSMEPRSLVIALIGAMIDQ